MNEIDRYNIIKDVHRTLPDENMFDEDIKSGENKLFNVLCAFACYDHEVGYVQGMNYLAGLLLLHMESEVDAFWCLVHLLHRKNWRQIYS